MKKVSEQQKIKIKTFYNSINVNEAYALHGHNMKRCDVMIDIVTK